MGREVAAALRLSERQVRRLRRRFEAAGAEGLLHRSRGRASPRRLGRRRRQQVARLLTTTCATRSGRRGSQRLWDLAERWYPEAESIPWPEAKQLLAEKSFRALGVRFENGDWQAHPDAEDGPVPKRVTFLSPFDRLIHDRDRAEALWGFRYRLEMYVPKPKREYGYYVLPILQGDRLIGRIDPVLDRKTGVLHVKGIWWEPGVKPVSVQKPLRSLATFIGAGSIEI